MLLLQPRVISTRGSRYIAHRVPIIEPPIVEPMELDEAIEMLEYVVSALASDEASYAHYCECLSASPNNLQFARGKQRALQAMNLMISMKKKEIARVLGMTESSFTTKYLPRKMNQMWFCVEPCSPYRTPVDFIRMVLCLLRKNGSLGSHVF